LWWHEGGLVDQRKHGYLPSALSSIATNPGPARPQRKSRIRGRIASRAGESCEVLDQTSRRSICDDRQTFTIREAHEEVGSDHIDVADRPFEP
jgi:hypothetical protein